ncbi:MAG: cell division protein FtsA [Leptospiraceae bacterium]|nr:cell division protein FtsA [Leptospiraceae bacterium]MDW7976441.1 cell division protein FtsA [Leptospiraceae bacterium]
MNTLFCAVDIGSFSTKCVIAAINTYKKIEVLGFSNVLSEGIKNAEIINIEKAIASVKASISEATKMSGITKIHRVVVNISSSKIRSESSIGICSISNEDRIITDEDVDRAIQNAKEIQIPSEYSILHILSREYLIDRKMRVPNPLGMVGSRLEADVLIIISPINLIKNIYKIFQHLDLEIDHLVLNAIASSEAVIKESERNSNFIVIDIGHETTDVAVINHGSYMYTFSIPLGGYHFTSDLGSAFKLPTFISEILKKRDGIAFNDDIDPTKKVEIPSSPGGTKRFVYLKDIAMVLEARAEELFEIIYKIIHKKLDKDKQNFSFVVLTGGGSLLVGLDKIAEKIFGIPSKIGKPVEIEDVFNEVASPEFSTAMGLIKFMSKHIMFERLDKAHDSNKTPKKDTKIKGIFRHLFG